MRPQSSLRGSVFSVSHESRHCVPGFAHFVPTGRHVHPRRLVSRTPLRFQKPVAQGIHANATLPGKGWMRPAMPPTRPECHTAGTLHRAGGSTFSLILGMMGGRSRPSAFAVGRLGGQLALTLQSVCRGLRGEKSCP